VWLAHRRGRQAIFLELLRSSRDPLILEQGLYHWLADAKTGATADYLMVSKEWREGVVRVFLNIDRILTQDQRAHFSVKLQVLIQDIQDLIGENNKKQFGV
jgi:hypothetical protein